MDHSFCPGSKLLRQPAPELFPCPNCGTEVEIWTDELKGICPSCKKAVFRDGGMSCLDWCKYGKECVGDAAYKSYMRNKAVGVKQRLLEKLEEHFGEDRRRIEHAKEVLRFAEELMKTLAADWHIVVPAALLHDIGIKTAEQKYGSAAARYQELEGPPIAKAILLKLGFQLADIEEVCQIIGHHHSPGKVDSQNFKLVYDADCLVNLAEAVEKKPQAEIQRLIDALFLTPAGRELAVENYLKASVKT